MGLGLKDARYIANKYTIGLGVTMHVTCLSGHNDTHAVFMLVTDLTALYYNLIVIMPATHSMGDYTIYSLIYRDHLLPCIQQQPERVELTELTRERFWSLTTETPLHLE